MIAYKRITIFYKREFVRVGSKKKVYLSQIIFLEL